MVQPGGWGWRVAGTGHSWECKSTGTCGGGEGSLIGTNGHPIEWKGDSEARESNFAGTEFCLLPAALTVVSQGCLEISVTRFCVLQAAVTKEIWSKPSLAPLPRIMRKYCTMYC